MSHSVKHDSLFKPGAAYLSRECDCGPCVLVEPGKRFGLSGVMIPDLFGWRDAWHSFDVDVKVSVSDAQAHMKKGHVIEPATGVGNYRYLLCPEYMIEGHESWLPEWMGLLWHSAEGVREHREAQRIHRKNLSIELGLALTAWKHQAWHQVGAPNPSRGKGEGKQAISGPVMQKIEKYVAANPECTAANILKEYPDLPYKTKLALCKAMEASGRFKAEVDMGMTYFTVKATAKQEAA